MKSMRHKPQCSVLTCLHDSLIPYSQHFALACRSNQGYCHMFVRQDVATKPTICLAFNSWPCLIHSHSVLIIDRNELLLTAFHILIETCFKRCEIRRAIKPSHPSLKRPQITFYTSQKTKCENH